MSAVEREELSLEDVRQRLSVAVVGHNDDDTIVSVINENLKRFEEQMKQRRVALGRHAGVLVILHRVADGSIGVLLTQRTAHLNAHSGQVCLPGGKVDESDPDLVHTALRETLEEIGFSVDRSDIVCAMPPTVASSNVVVTPVVAVVDRELAPLHPNPNEVECIFTCPLSVFLSKEYHRSAMITYHGHDFRVHYFSHENQTIWGLTGRVMIQVAMAVYQCEPEFSLDNSNVFTLDSSL